MFWTPGCTIMIQWTYLIHCTHYHKVRILFKYTGIFFTNWTNTEAPGEAQMSGTWVITEQEQRKRLLWTWVCNDGDRNNSGKFWCRKWKGVWGRGEATDCTCGPSGTTPLYQMVTMVRGGQKQQRGQGHTLEERHVWPRNHCHLHSSPT